MGGLPTTKTCYPPFLKYTSRFTADASAHVKSFAFKIHQRWNIDRAALHTGNALALDDLQARRDAFVVMCA